MGSHTTCGTGGMSSGSNFSGVYSSSGGNYSGKLPSSNSFIPQKEFTSV